ncbi:MAG TPA: efflux RND transporter periplasmic adaptor subunit [Verrucomicrobiae bacterium]|jgi:RND family efflux transporter MFP subunit
MLSTKFFGPTILFVSIFALGIPAHADTIQVTGITEPYNRVDLGFPDAGIIHVENFQEGDSVKKGDVILELDKNLEAIEVTRTEAIMTQNKTVYESTLQLFQSTKSVSQEDLDKSAAEYHVAAAQYQTAVQQLANRQLIAPFSGTITEMPYKPGAVVAPYVPFVQLVDSSRCYFRGNVDGITASKLQLDESVQIQLQGGETVSGKICYISPIVDPASGLARIKAIFDNTDGKIRPGVSATLTAN